jgi:hypothetical protein
MTFKDDVRRKTGAFLTSSQEIFEKIFAQATRELKIERKPKPAIQKPVTAPSTEAPRIVGKKPGIAMTAQKPVPTYKTSEKVKASPKPKPKEEPSPRKRPRLLRAGLLLILLLVLAGFAANHFAIIDLNAIPDLLGLGPKQVIQAPIPRKQPAKPSQKPVVSPTQPRAQEATPTTPPAPSVPTPPAASKEEKLVQLETPTTIAQSEPGKQQVQEKAPTPSPVPSASTPPAASKEETLVKLETPTAIAQPTVGQESIREKVSSASTIDEAKSAVVAVKKESTPVPVQAQASAKITAPEVAPSQPVTPQYPYSVYLGSFKAPEAVKKALADYQEKELSVYWARVDLGDKGVWFRFFTGYFRTKEEAQKYISERNLQGATPGITKYANLIGRYGSDKEVEEQKRALVSAGFYPYVIKGTNGKSLIYSGAFDRKEYAEKEQNALASKGIKSEVVER